VGEYRQNRGLQIKNIYRLIYVHISYYNIPQSCVLEGFVTSRRPKFFYVFIRIIHAILFGAFRCVCNFYAVVMCISSNILQSGPPLEADGDSSVGTATCYGLGGPGFESRWRQVCHIRQDRAWGPPSLLYNGHRVSLTRGEAAGEWH
jgi:hypothetical protein